MKPALDKNFKNFSSRQLSGETRTRFTAADHVQGLKMLEKMNEMADIEQFKDSLELSINHPYFYRARDLQVLEIVDNCVELLRTIMARDPAPEQGAGLIPAPNNPNSS